MANSQITLTISESDTDAGGVGIDGQPIDLSHFFNELSFETADSITAATTVSRAEMIGEAFYMDYPDLQDPNHNSWAFVETYDQYDDQGQPKPTN